MNNPIAFLKRVWGFQCQEGDFVAVSAKGSTWKDFTFPWDANLDQALTKWLTANSTKDLYFCPLPFSEPRRAKGSAARSRLLWSDMDYADPHKVEPAILWESSPGRFQGLWILPKTIEAEEASQLSKQLAYYIGADKGGWDLTQVLRIPGTPNNKYDDKPIVKLIHFKNTVLRKVPQSVLDKWRATIPRKLIRIIEGPAEQGKRSDMLWYLEHELCDLGIPIKDVFLILRQSDWNKYAGRDDEDERFASEMEKIKADRGVKESVTRVESVSLIVESYSDLMSKQNISPGWMIKDYWMRHSHGIIAGEPKSFKSTLALDLLFSVASTKPFLGQFAVEYGGPVLIVQNENADWIMKDRLEKLSMSRGEIGNVRTSAGRQLRIEWGRKLPMFFVNQQGFTLDDAANKEALEELIDKIRPAAINLDPLYLMFSGDVNSAKDLNPMLTWCLYIKQRYDCSIILIHHYNKNGDGKRGGQRMLGSTTLHGWIESAWYIQAQENEGAKAAVVIDREFRGAGLYPKVNVTMDMGDVGDPRYSATVSDHTPEKEVNAEQTILDCMSTMAGASSKTDLMKSCGLSRHMVDKTMDALLRAGAVYRRGERYAVAGQST